MNTDKLESAKYQGRTLKIMRDGKLYLHRFVIARNRFFSIYLHFTYEDDYPVLHDHPWDNISIVLSGGYYETVPAPITSTANLYRRTKRIHWRGPGSIIKRSAEQAHSLSLPRNGRRAISLFITGPRRRTWGFHTKLGRLPYDQVVEYVDGQSRVIAGKEDLLT